MPKHLNTAHRINLVLRPFPKLRRKIETIGAKYYCLRENSDYDLNYNGERWIAQKLERQALLNTVFDVGANLGDWTAMILEANPASRVDCFEICPPTFQKLSARFSSGSGHRPNIFLNSFGLSDVEAQIHIKHLTDNDGGGTMFILQKNQKTETIPALVRRGCDYCLERNIVKIDFLKMDVEGAEDLVLKGFGDMLHASRIPVVQFEYGMCNIVTKFLLRDFYHYFESRGYKIGKLFPDFVRFRDYRFEDENFLGPNYIAVRPDLVPLLKGAG